MVMQRIANPFTSVRFRPGPPNRIPPAASGREVAVISRRPERRKMAWPRGRWRVPLVALLLVGIALAATQPEATAAAGADIAFGHAEPGVDNPAPPFHKQVRAETPAAVSVVPRRPLPSLVATTGSIAALVPALPMHAGVVPLLGGLRRRDRQARAGVRRNQRQPRAPPAGSMKSAARGV